MIYDKLKYEYSMKPKFKIYLDISVISALFDGRNPERKELTENFFEQSKTNWNFNPCRIIVKGEIHDR